MPDANAPDHLRLFIAVQIPEPIKAEMERAQADLRHDLPEAAVRWTRAGQFHLTLRFLGNVPARQVQALVEAVRAVGRRFAPLQLRAETVGFFPNPRAPRVVWAGVWEAQDQLLALQRSVQAACAPFTAQAPEDRFTGHVTLGRVKGLTRLQTATLVGRADVMTGRKFGEWTATDLEIMRSELSSQGARHECLSAARLGG